MSARTCERSKHVSEPNDRTAEGVVLELLPSLLVRVELDGPIDSVRGRRHVVTAHLASPVGRNYVRVIKGDRVRVQLMANDPHRGRVVEKI
jgi:translation initiation factor IF-1